MITRCRSAIIHTLFAATSWWVAASGPAVLAQGPQIAEDAQADQAFARFVRTRWVLLDERNGLDGAIGTFDAVTGKLNPTSAIRIDLYNANAELAYRVTTGPSGRFRLPDLEGGLYQFVARGSRGLLAFSLFAIERGQPSGRTDASDSTILVQAPRQTKDRLDILSAAVPPTFTQLNAILRLNFGRTTPAYLGNFGASATAANDAQRDLRDLIRPEDGERPAAAVASAIRAHDVLLRNGNRMVGRLYTMNANNGSPQAIRDVYVHIIRNDRLMGPPIPVNEEGVFEAELYDGPGAYSIVAAGSGGFAACSFYARRVSELNPVQPVSVTLASMRIAQRPPEGAELVPPADAAQNAGQSYQITMSLVSDPRVIQQAFPAAVPSDALSDAGAALPAGGFGAEPAPLAGGGAAGVGGGVARALLFGGGLAAGITALAVDDGQRRPVSPFVP